MYEQEGKGTKLKEGRDRQMDRKRRDTSESESESYLLPSRFTPTWNLFWCIGAYSEHKTYKHNKYYT